MNLLRLFLTAGWPSQDASCEWALIDTESRQLQRGHSEPRHWPAADECEIVLSAEQCLTLRSRLPKGAKSRLPEVISFALEENLIGDAEAEHFVAGTADADGMTPVWVIARSRLKGLLATLNSVGRTPQRACCEIQLAPLNAGCWSVCLREPGGSTGSIFGFARTGPEEGFAFEFGESSKLREPPLELRLALQAAQAAGKAPRAIDIYAAPGSLGGAATDIAASWQTVLALPVRSAGEYAWHESAIAANATRNLLTHEFAPPRRAQDGWGSFRPAIFLALAGGVVFMLFSFGEWVWLSHQSNNLLQQMAATFRSAFPQAQTVVDPPLQMQRLYDQLRRERGQLGAGDFLPLLAAATETTGGQGALGKVGYEEGRLELSLVLANAETAERLRDAMKSRGLTVTLRDTHPAKGGGGVEAIFAVRSAP